jgi:hypothetical protein
MQTLNVLVFSENCLIRFSIEFCHKTLKQLELLEPLEQLKQLEQKI